MASSRRVAAVYLEELARWMCGSRLHARSIYLPKICYRIRRASDVARQQLRALASALVGVTVWVASQVSQPATSWLSVLGQNGTAL